MVFGSKLIGRLKGRVNSEVRFTSDLREQREAAAIIKSRFGRRAQGDPMSLMESYPPLVAVKDGKVIGTIFYRQNEKMLEVEGIATSRWHEGRGVGGQLLDGIVAHAKSTNCTHIILKGNTRARTELFAAYAAKRGLEAMNDVSDRKATTTYIKLK